MILYRAFERRLPLVSTVLRSRVRRGGGVKPPPPARCVPNGAPARRGLILRNNTSRDQAPLKQTNVVYRYKCTIGDCALLPHSAYIGNTTTSLSRRITMHLQQGGPLAHTLDHHGEQLTRQQMTQNTEILARAQDRRRLLALEAIYIRELDPTINKQVNARGTLQLHGGAPRSLLPRH